MSYYSTPENELEGSLFGPSGGQPPRGTPPGRGGYGGGSLFGGNEGGGSWMPNWWDDATGMFNPDTASQRGTENAQGFGERFNNTYQTIRDALLGTSRDAYIGNQRYQIEQAYNMLGGPQLEQSLANQAQNYLNQALTGQAMFGEQRGNLQREADLKLRGLGLDRAGLGIDRGAAQRDIGSTRNLMDLNWQQFWNQLGGIEHSQQQAQRALTNDAVSRGALATPGTRKDFTDIERETELAATGERIGFQQRDQGLRDKLGSAQDVLKKIDLEGKRLNLSAEQIANSLQQGLTRLGLNELTSVSDLMNRAASTNIEQQQLAGNLLAQAGQLAGLNLFSQPTQPREREHDVTAPGQGHPTAGL